MFANNQIKHIKRFSMEETPITAGQVLYDRTGMCIENHPSIKEAMEQYAQAKV